MKKIILLFLLAINLFASANSIGVEKGEGDKMNPLNKKIIKISHNRREIYGVAYLPEIEKEYPIVIFSHGFNGTNRDFAMYGQYLAERGIGAYAFDFCGGSVSSKSTLKTNEMTIFTEKEDLSAVIEEVRTWEKVDKNNVFLFGGSQGGLVTALVAEEYEKETTGILLLFPAFCIAEDWTKRFPNYENIPEKVDLWGVTLGREFFQTIHKYDVYKNIGKYSKNVLIFHGDKDEIVSLDYSKKARDLYSNVKLEVFTGEGHGFSNTGNKKVVQMVEEFVKTNSSN